MRHALTTMTMLGSGAKKRQIENYLKILVLQQKYLLASPVILHDLIQTQYRHYKPNGIKRGRDRL